MFIQFARPPLLVSRFQASTQHPQWCFFGRPQDWIIAGIRHNTVPLGLSERREKEQRGHSKEACRGQDLILLD